MRPTDNKPTHSSPTTSSLDFPDKSGRDSLRVKSIPLRSRVLDFIISVIMFIPKNIKKYAVRSFSPENLFMSQRATQAQENTIPLNLVAAMEKPVEAARLFMQLSQLGVTDVDIFTAACQNNKNSSVEQALNILITEKYEGKVPSEFIRIIVTAEEQTRAANLALQLHNMGATDVNLLQENCRPLRPEN